MLVAIGPRKNAGSRGQTPLSGPRRTIVHPWSRPAGTPGWGRESGPRGKSRSSSASGVMLESGVPKLSDCACVVYSAQRGVKTGSGFVVCSPTQLLSECGVGAAVPRRWPGGLLRAARPYSGRPEPEGAKQDLPFTEKCIGQIALLEGRVEEGVAWAGRVRFFEPAANFLRHQNEPAGQVACSRQSRAETRDPDRLLRFFNLTPTTDASAGTMGRDTPCAGARRRRASRRPRHRPACDTGACARTSGGARPAMAFSWGGRGFSGSAFRSRSCRAGRA